MIEKQQASDPVLNLHKNISDTVTNAHEEILLSLPLFTAACKISGIRFAGVVL